MFIKKKFLSIFLTAFLSLSVCYGETKVEEPSSSEQEVDINKISKAFGHLIGKNLDSLGFEFNMADVIKGIEDSLAGKESPMNENECIQAISLAQEEAFQKLAEENLTKANEFMEKNSKKEGIIELEKNKLQCKIEQKGEGVVVEEYFSPVIRYSGKFLDGKVFGASQEDELVALDEVIPGFSKGIIGMKEGEKRTIYIHPDLGYGTSGYLPPNSLLVFDIELIKANTTPQQEESMTTIPDGDAKEIADGPKEEAVR